MKFTRSLFAAVAVLSVAPAIAHAQPKFDKVEVSTVGGFVMFRSDFTLAADGKAHLDHQGVAPGAPSASWDGQATSAELKAVESAFAKADPASLPGKLAPTHAIPDKPDQVLAGSIGGKAFKTTASFGEWGTYESRVRPLLDALGKIRDRLAKQPVLRTLHGQVFASGAAVTISENKSSGWTVLNEPFRTILKGMEGKTVDARVEVVQNGMFGGTCNVVSLPGSNTVKELYGIVFASNGTVHVSANKSSVWEVTNEPFKSILKAQEGRYVSVQIKVVKAGMFGGTCEVLTLAAGNSKDLNVRSKPQVLGSKVLGKIDASKGLQIIGSSGKNYYVVSFNGKKGYVLANQVTIGSKVATTTPGISHSIPGAP